jgi:hypothetical protein
VKDLLEVLKKAQAKGGYASVESLKKELERIRKHDEGFIMDWDEGAGEEWIRFGHHEFGTVFMISSKLRLIFARESYFFKIPRAMLERFEIVAVENYDNVEWCLDLQQLKLLIPQISWDSSGVDPDGFSLNDFYFATV